MMVLSTCKESWFGFITTRPEPDSQTHCKILLSNLSNQNIYLEMSTYFPRVFSALEGHNKSTSFIIPQFQQMVWTIKSQFEPIKNVIYSISRQYHSSSTSLLICHYKDQINLHLSHSMTFCLEFWIFLSFFFFFPLLNYSSPLSSTAMWPSITYPLHKYIYLLEEYLVFM